MELNEGATPEVENKEVNIEVPEKSMDDTIRETLRSMKDKGTEIVENKPVEDIEQKANRIRDEKGKFAEKQPVVGENTITPEIIEKPAPNTWKKEVAEKWNTLPPEVRAEVERRESDFHKGIEQYKTQAQMAQSFERAIAPYMATINSLGITPDKAVGELMAADHRLRYGSPQEKNAYFQQLAQSYGVDLSQAVQAQQQIDPYVSNLQQQVQQLQGYLQNQQNQVKMQEAQTLNSEIGNFASDPKHSHFESVKEHMAALLQAGQAKDLPDAYEQAVWANPTTRQAMIAEQQTKLREEATQKAQAAKQAASVNIKSRPSMPVSTPIGTMDDTIRATLRRLQSA